jgi:hypothetical protein
MRLRDWRIRIQKEKKVGELGNSERKDWGKHRERRRLGG